MLGRKITTRGATKVVPVTLTFGICLICSKPGLKVIKKIVVNKTLMYPQTPEPNFS